jgi:predicted RNA-binding protein with PUA-like domain
VVTISSFPDPTATNGDWSAVEIKPVRPVSPPVTLDKIKSDPALAQIPLLRQSRLSVMSLSKTEFEGVLGLAGA